MEEMEKADRLLSIKMLVKATGLSESYFRVGWCKGRLNLPFVKLGKAVRVKQSEYHKWLDANSSVGRISKAGCA